MNTLDKNSILLEVGSADGNDANLINNSGITVIQSDISFGMVKLAKDNKLHGEAYNFGPPDIQDYSVRDLIEEMKKNWSNVQWNDVSNSKDNPHEAGLLKLNCEKSFTQLNWKPTMNFKQTIQMTIDWYKQFYENDSADMYELTLKQIEEYNEIAKTGNISWAEKD